jgi:hypothetical protein
MRRSAPDDGVITCEDRCQLVVDDTSRALSASQVGCFGVRMFALYQWGCGLMQRTPCHAVARCLKLHSTI